METAGSSSSSVSAAPVDLELHARTILTGEGLALRYVLTSPSRAVADCFHRDAGIRSIGSEEVFANVSCRFNRIFLILAIDGFAHSFG